MIMFQLSFGVASDKAEEFERTYQEVFEPALSRQDGFLGATFCRLFAADVVKEIEAAPSTEFALVWGFLGRKNAQQGGLARAVGTEDSDSITLAYVADPFSHRSSGA